MGKLTDYGLPIVGALVLHAVVVAMLEWEWAPGSREPVVRTAESDQGDAHRS